jgi:hypothetical protein
MRCNFTPSQTLPLEGEGGVGGNAGAKNLDLMTGHEMLSTAIPELGVDLGALGAC